ncbi:MAG TPA: di-heme oxidoredictase family protein [Gemmatimonadaceae bacterium]|nr:di-heme oxidoredictase family protein [Gemmatimonadaceae bacterium]
MHPATRSTGCLLAVAALAACSDDSTLPPTAPTTAAPTGVALAMVPDPKAHTDSSGGKTTVFDATSAAFSLMSPNVKGGTDEFNLHEEGDEQFEDAFTVNDPASDHNGLGPVFDNVSCEGCHGGDGRGRPPGPNEIAESFLVRISYPGRDPTTGAPRPVPGYGGQLQLRAIPGVAPEASVSITYTEVGGTFADGTPYSLRVPSYSFYGSYEELSKKMLFSPRVAPFNFGLGLLEAIPEATILANEDPNDVNRDGISGVANRVWDAAANRTAIGRFGWKAGVPNVVQQTAGAYNGDMGVTSPMFPAESCEGDRPECAPHAPEVSSDVVLAVARYMQTLGVPARRNLDDAQATQGEAVFYQVGCAGCHTPTVTTGTLAGVPSVANQVIHPYTDLLLHDMGADLADGRPDFQANGREWRTPPLWGIGLVQTVNGHSNFLHDGRARGLLEAVLWHGGEAKKSRDAVVKLSPNARAALVKFLESL